MINDSVINREFGYKQSSLCFRYSREMNHINLIFIPVPRYQLLLNDMQCRKLEKSEKRFEKRERWDKKSSRNWLLSTLYWIVDRLITFLKHIIEENYVRFRTVKGGCLMDRYPSQSQTQQQLGVYYWYPLVVHFVRLNRWYSGSETKRSIEPRSCTLIVVKVSYTLRKTFDSQF